MQTNYERKHCNSSFVFIDIESSTLEKLVSDYGLTRLFEKLWNLYFVVPLTTELDKSFAQSIINILKTVLEDVVDYGYLADKVDVKPEQINQLIRFILKNKAIIDSEAEGTIELKGTSDQSWYGFSYVQKLTYKNHHGRLVKWPCSGGWDSGKGGGYDKILDFSENMFREEIPELVGVGSCIITELIWDDNALETAIEKTGVIEEFDVEPAAEGVIPDFDPDLCLNEIEPANVDWISGALFDFSGLERKDELLAAGIIEDNGGIVERCISSKTDYIIYNLYCKYNMPDLQKAQKLIKRGKNIQLLTVSEFCKKLITDSYGKILPKPEKKQISLPKTMKECRRIFECYVTSDQSVCIRGILKSTDEVIIPGIIDGMPVAVHSGAFQEDEKLERLVFMEGVTSIGGGSFRDCKLLKEVVFSDTIDAIGSGCFSNTPWRKAQGDWFIFNNVLISYTGTENDVVIPNGIVGINSYAFYSRQNLKSVVIPDSVTYIGDFAFACRDLTDIRLPDHKIEFGYNPFADTEWAKSQPDWLVMNDVLLGVNEDYYFENSSKCTSLTIPEDIRVIGANSLGGGCTKWENVKTVYLPNGLEVIGAYAFSGCISLEEIVLPSTLKKIEKYAFNGCPSLVKLNFAEGLKEIGKGAFNGWSEDTNAETNAIEEIILPDTVEVIGPDAFGFCQKLRKLRLPRHLDVIPKGMANVCSNIRELIMPEECRVIGFSAFAGCEELEKIKLPENLESIEAAAFSGCTKLQSLELPSTVRNFGWVAFEECNSITSVTIPDGVRELPDRLFNHCDRLESVKIPASMTEIGEGVFDECPKLTLSVTAGSVAEKYAEDNNIPYIIE